MEWTHESKLNQRNKIEALNSYQKSLKVFKIIVKHNKKLKFSWNQNGVFLFYQKLNRGTYKEIQKFLDADEKHKIRIQIPQKFEEYAPKPFTDLDTAFQRGRLKHTAKEKQILLAKKWC